MFSFIIVVVIIGGVCVVDVRVSVYVSYVYLIVYNVLIVDVLQGGNDAK
jgi:hypothetical protein